MPGTRSEARSQVNSAPQRDTMWKDSGLGTASQGNSISANYVNRTKIALWGIFGIENIGNECTLQAMLHNVRHRMPDAELYSICYDPQDTFRRHALKALPIRSEYSKSHTSNQSPRQGNKASRYLRRIFRRLPNELRHWFRVFRALKGTNLVAMTGTGMLTDFSTSSFGYPYDIFKWSLAARLAGCKVRFVGIGVGPIYERLSRWFIKSALSLADYRSYRDEESKVRLERLAFDTNRDPVFPDLAFSLPHCILPQCNTCDRQKRLVGVGIMNYFDPHATRQDDRQPIYHAYLDKMCEFTGWLIERGYGVRILQGDLRHDATVRRDLRARLEKRGFRYDNSGILDEDIASVEDLLTQLAQLDVVVSPRFHNLILALMLNKPVISISYDPKSDALLEGFGLGKYCQPIDDLNVDTLIAQFLDLDARIEEIKPLLRDKTEEYRTLLDQQYRVLLGDL